MKRIIILAIIITAQIVFSAEKPKQVAKPKAVKVDSAAASLSRLAQIADIEKQIDNSVRQFEASLSADQRQLRNNQIYLSGQLYLLRIMTDSTINFQKSSVRQQ